VPSGKLITDFPSRIFRAASARFCRLAVDLYIAGVFHGPAEDGDPKEFLLGDPAELAG